MKVIKRNSNIDKQVMKANKLINNGNYQPDKVDNVEEEPKMYLDESLFESYTMSLKETIEQDRARWAVINDDGTYAGNPCYSIDEARELVVNSDRERKIFSLVPHKDSALEQLDEAAGYYDKGKIAKKIADDIFEFLNNLSAIPDTVNYEDLISESDLKQLADATDILDAFAYFYSKAKHPVESINEVVQKGTKLGPRKSKWGNAIERDDEWDLFTAVNDELSPTEWGNKRAPYKILDTTPRHRYNIDEIGVDADDNVVVYQESESGFDFAKRVADVYGLKTKGPVSDGANFKFTIIIPSEEQPD